MKYHEPVMLKEVMGYLAPKPADKIIDCTLGDAGHTIEFLKSGAKVLGIEVNTDALERAKIRISSEGLSQNFIGINSNFKELERIAQENNFSQVSGILYDLGFSSYELDESDIGLSFLKEDFLDMRLDKSLGVTAADLLNALPQKQLEQIISEYGGELLAKRFAKAIVNFRNLKQFHLTTDLSDLLKSVAPPNYERGRIHPATRTFQALRIAVNNETDNLSQSLPQAAHVLLPGGRMVIISFHSLEDRIAKSIGHGVQPLLKAITKKPITPSEMEIKQNIRSRSAKMRVYERI